MILFLHGIHQSAGTFLPIIKSMIGEVSFFDDKYLIDSFCLWIPGYNKKDTTFDYRYIENEIYNFVEDKQQAQNDIADKILLSESKLHTNLLKDKKLNLIGCDVGAAIAIDFTIQNLEVVSSLSLIDCGTKFDSLKARWEIFNTRQILKAKPDKIKNRFDSENNTYKKIFLAHLIEYPNGKGVDCLLKMMSDFNFEKSFNRLSLDQQKVLMTIPMLCIIDKKHGLSNNSSIRKIQKTFEKQYQYINKKHTIIDSNFSKKMLIETLSFSNSSILNSQTALEISNKIIKFYQS